MVLAAALGLGGSLAALVAEEISETVKRQRAARAAEAELEATSDRGRLVWSGRH